jgi:hypothetical protein
VITRNDAVTFTGFLDQLGAVVAPGHEVHIVLDNGSSHTAKHTKAWLALHPRWHVRHGDFASRNDDREAGGIHDRAQRDRQALPVEL